MRMPMPVEPGEASRSQRLVKRGEGVEPRIPLDDPAGKASQVPRELWIKQSGPARPTAVVTEADDGPDAEVPQTAEPLVGPAPIGIIGIIGDDALPEHRVAEGANAERGEPVEIIEPRIVTGA